MNLCYPDGNKSCAACCGLYNVVDGTRFALKRKLKARTRIFGETERTAQALIDFEQFVRGSEDSTPIDEAIHVCEFTGFIDEDLRTVGCLLHPTAPGNGGIDLRGLCHYGSMACKAFFCPASELMESAHREIVVPLIDDWHLYGLVATDLDFVESVFRLVEGRLKGPLTWELLSRNTEACAILKEMFQWKNDGPFGRDSFLRRSRYYFKRSESLLAKDPDDDVDRLLACTRFTFGGGQARSDERSVVEEKMQGLVKACNTSALSKR